MRATLLQRLAALRAREDEFRARFGLAAPIFVKDCPDCGNPLPANSRCVGVDCASHDQPDRE